MPYAKSKDVDIYYEAHGEGYPLIFIHGGGGNTMAWYQQVPYFSKKYKVITVDLRGFKYSRCPENLVHPQYFADDMRAVLDAEKAPHAAFICQSLGAWAGLRVAVQTPERVSLLFINGSPTPVYSEENDRVLERANGFFMGGDFARGTGVGWNRQTVAERPEMLFLYGQIKSLNPEPGFNSYTMADASTRVQPGELEGFEIPTIVCGGSHDDFLNPRSHFHAASLIPGAETHTFPDSGHSAYFEHAREFNEVLDAYLKRVLPARGVQAG